jgi:hypothetical protein
MTRWVRCRPVRFGDRMRLVEALRRLLDLDLAAALPPARLAVLRRRAAELGRPEPRHGRDVLKVDYGAMTRRPRFLPRREAVVGLGAYAVYLSCGGSQPRAGGALRHLIYPGTVRPQLGSRRAWPYGRRARGSGAGAASSA